MAQPNSSEPPPSPSTTQNPIVAVGRKVKSVLSSHQRPSVRILRESSSSRKSRVPASKTKSEKSGSRFGRGDNIADDESFEHEYDPDTVDLLDVVGMYDQARIQANRLTLYRPGSIYAFYPHQCPKLALRPFPRENYQSSTNV